MFFCNAGVMSMKKAMILATVAMMGMGFAGDANAAPSMKSVSSSVSSATSKALSVAAKLAADPIVGALLLNELKDVMVKSTAKRLNFNSEEVRSLNDSFDSIISLVQSKAARHSS